MNLNPTVPEGAYYIMVNFSQHQLLSQFDDVQLANFLLTKSKVAIVPGRFFYNDYKDGVDMFRICYALNEEKVTQGLEQLQRLISKVGK
jgi:aspartate/methionine/tyrosine aminotransferase